jgi:hypothetical protein
MQHQVIWREAIANGEDRRVVVLWCVTKDIQPIGPSVSPFVGLYAAPSHLV